MAYQSFIQRPPKKLISAENQKLILCSNLELCIIYLFQGYIFVFRHLVTCHTDLHLRIAWMRFSVCKKSERKN
jgi:hypothetical protein